jgi:hypothetical protein
MGTSLLRASSPHGYQLTYNSLQKKKTMNEQREINKYFLLYTWRGYGRVEGDVDSAQLRDD